MRPQPGPAPSSPGSQARERLLPPLAILKTALPPMRMFAALREAAASRVIWPPVLKACFPAGMSVTVLPAALRLAEKPIGLTHRDVRFRLTVLGDERAHLVIRRVPGRAVHGGAELELEAGEDGLADGLALPVGLPREQHLAADDRRGQGRRRRRGRGGGDVEAAGGRRARDAGGRGHHRVAGADVAQGQAVERGHAAARRHGHRAVQDAPAGVVRQADGHRAVIRRLEGPRVAVLDGDGEGERGARLDRGRRLGRDHESSIKGSDAEGARVIGEPNVPVRPGREPLRDGDGGQGWVMGTVPTALVAGLMLWIDPVGTVREPEVAVGTGDDPEWLRDVPPLGLSAGIP